MTAAVCRKADVLIAVPQFCVLNKLRGRKMAGRKYKEPKEGEWVQPVRRAYRMRCCDCGLVHIMDFRLVKRGNGKTIQFRAGRDNRATAGGRVTSMGITYKKGTKI